MHAARNIGDTASAAEQEHGAAVCRRAKHPRVQHLITGDEHSLADVELLLATLPMCSTGRVFLEVPHARFIVPITAPPRMIVTWLDRSVRSGSAGTGLACPVGAALTRAVSAWASEMLYECDSSCTTVTLTGGYLGTADIAEYLHETIGLDAATIRTPERFGLFADRR